MKNTRLFLDLLVGMTEKELKVRYKNTVLGFLWIILNPILQMFFLGFVLSFFIKIPNYFLFLFSGLLPWQFVSLTLSRATNSIVNERAILFKAKIPIEVIPFSIVLSGFVHLVVSFFLFFVVLIFLGKASLVGLLLTLLAFLWLFFFLLGTSFLAAGLNVRFRDVGFVVQSFLTLWFYTTPVIYSLKLIPEKYLWLYNFNPLTSIFQIIQQGLWNEGTLNPVMVISNAGITILIIFLGYVYWKKESKYFVDWL